MDSARKPVPKVAAVGGAGVVVTAVVALLAAFGIVIPDEITNQAVILITAIVSAVTFVAGYVKRSPADDVYRQGGRGAG